MTDSAAPSGSPVTVSCHDDFGSDCPAVFTTASVDELLTHVELHATKTHGMDWTKELVEVVKAKSHDG